MTHTINYEFGITLIGRNERLGEDYYKTKTYTYYVPEDKVKKAIIEAVLKDYAFKEKQELYRFIEYYNLWYQLEDTYNDLIDEWLYDECYDDAEKEFIKELRV